MHDLQVVRATGCPHGARGLLQAIGFRAPALPRSAGRFTAADVTKQAGQLGVCLFVRRAATAMAKPEQAGTIERIFCICWFRCSAIAPR